MHKLPLARSFFLASLFTIAAVSVAPSHAVAATYSFSGSSDITYNIGSGPAETTYGYSLAVTVTVPSSVTPSTSYSVTTTKSLTGSQFLACRDYPGENEDCNSGNAALWSYQNGSSFAYTGWGSDTTTSSITSGASGSDTISFMMRPAAGFSWGAKGLKGGFSYPYVTMGSISVPISAQATVNIYFQ